MHEILEYLRGLSPQEREAFAARCETSVGYLRKAVSTKQQLGIELCIRLDRESGGVLRCERLFPGLDWSYLRKSASPARADVSGKKQTAAPAHQAPAAIKTEAQEVAHG